jgi:hypothetical protein
MAKKKKWTERELIDLIKFRFLGDKYVVLEKVANKTGAWTDSWVDAAVFALWPSEGLIRKAFEVKCTRADFIRELGNPTKNEWARKSFHEFWFVAPTNVIKESEIPEGCGWMRPHGQTLATIVHAKRHEAELNDSLLASFMRSAHKQIVADRKAEIRKGIEEDGGYQEALAWKSAGQEFMAAKGRERWRTGTGHDEILDAFRKATIDKKNEKDRKQVLAVLDNFQRKMIDMLRVIGVLAEHSLVAVDKTGSHIVSAWGGSDELSMDFLRKVLKSEKRRGPHKSDMEKRLEVLDLLLSKGEEESGG